MAGGRPAAGCCCFVNNVRFPVLVLLTFSVAALYSTLILFNLTAILNPEVEWRPAPKLDTLHGSSYKGFDRVKRELDPPKIPSKVVRFDESIEEKEDDGHPILPPTEKPVVVTTTETPTTRTTERPKPIFITNRAETTTQRAERSTTTTVRIETTTTTDDVVAREVERSLKKLRDAEDGKVESPPERIETFESEKEPVSYRMKRGILYAAPGIGILIGIVLSVQLLKRWGARKLLSVCLAEAVCFTLFLVYAQKGNYYVLLLVRLAQGFIFSGVFPVMGSVLVQWGPLKEQLLFLTVMLMFISISPIVAWPVANYIQAIEASMDVVYFIQAVVIAILGLCWAIFYRDRPQTHPWVGGVELNRIVAGKVQELKTNRAPAESFSALLKSLAAWSILTSAFGLFSITAFFVTYLPAFLASPDVFFVEGLGIHGTIPFMMLPISCAIFASLNLLFEPSTKIIRILNTLAFLITALLVVSLPFVAFLQTRPGLMSILLLSMIPLGLSVVCGFVRSLTVVGRVFAEHIVAMCAIPFGLAFTIVPLMVSYFLAENKLSEWTKVVMFLFFILTAAAVEFAVFGRGKSPSWSESSWDPLVASTKMQSLALIDFNQDECGLYELRRIDPKQ